MINVILALGKKDKKKIRSKYLTAEMVMAMDEIRATSNTRHLVQ